MKPKQTLRLYNNVFDSSFKVFYFYFSSISSISALLAFAIFCQFYYQKYIYFIVFAYQLPNLIILGIIAIMMKKLKNQVKIKIDLSVIKPTSLLKIIERCFLQSRTAKFNLLSKTPQDDPANRQNTQKIKLMPKAIPKQYFLLQFVKKNVSIPSLIVYIKRSIRMQNDIKVQLGVKKLIIYLMARNRIKPADVICTLENSLAKGYYLTFQYCILITQTQFYVLSFFFLLGLFQGLSSGGINKTAPFGKNIKLGILLLIQCKPAQIDTSKTVSTIILIKLILINILNLKKETYIYAQLNNNILLLLYLYINIFQYFLVQQKGYISVYFLRVIIYNINNNKKDNICVYCMLIGDRQGQNERQIKLKKSKIYREMLDKQIVYNLRYKKEMDERNRQQQNEFIDDNEHDSSVMPIIEHKKAQINNLDQSYVNVGYKQHRTKSKNIYLPLIQDKNTYFKGHSTFIKPKQQQKPTGRKPHQIKTQPIHEESDDEYHSNCQRIIRQLQNITKVNPKSRARNRRKAYEYSELSNYRKNYSKQKSLSDNHQEENADADKSFDYKVPSMINFDKKINHPSIQQTPSTYLKDQKIYLHKDATKLQQYEIGNKTNKPNKSYSANLSDQPYSKPTLQKQTNQFSQYKTNFTGLQNKLKPIQQRNNQRQMIKINSNKIQSGTNDNSDKLKQKVKQTLQLNGQHDEEPKLGDKLRSSQQIIKLVQQHKAQAQLKRVQQQIRQVGLQVQRKNFIQLLRKVKNRGESLFLKLSKYPNKKIQAV